MRRCWNCWRDQKDREAHDEAWSEGFDEGYAAGRRSSSPPSLEGGLLGDLIALCHPDRHPVERFDLANAVTARLLELRERAA